MLFRPRSHRRHFKTLRGRWPTRVLGFESCNCCCCLSLPKGCCLRATTSRNIASSGGCRIQSPTSCTRSRSSRWRLPWATWPTAQVPVSVLLWQTPPWGLAPSSASHHSLPSGHPHCISGIAKLFARGTSSRKCSAGFSHFSPVLHMPCASQLSHLIQ